MKSFITSLAILAVTIALITVNNIFISRYLNELLVSLNTLPQRFDIISSQELESKSKNSLELLEKHLDFYSLSINARDLRDMHGYLSELYAAATSTDEASYSTALYKATTFASHLCTREGFNIKNII